MPGLIHDPRFCKLGRKPPVRPKGLKTLAQVLGPTLPEAPPNVGWTHGYRCVPGGPQLPIVDSWPMDGNDQYGDCVIAAGAHFQQLVTTLTGKPNVPTTDQVLAAYTAITGFNASDPSTDNGTDPMAFLQYWQTTGLWGTKIGPFVEANPASPLQIRDSIWFFGGALVGLALPMSAQDQDIWDVPPGGWTADNQPGSWGGHEVLGVSAGPRLVELITWGASKFCTYTFLSACCDQLSVVISPDWFVGGMSPGGVPLASALQDQGLLVKVA